MKQGANLVVKADKMRRFLRLDTISEEYSKENLEVFFAKLYRMRVVEKCRFQYKSARFKGDLERMHMLQEEALVHADSNEEAEYVSETVTNTEESKEHTRTVTKEIYEAMTDKEKAEWIGIDSNDMLVSIKLFHEKLKLIGITYQYISDETEECCRLEEVIKKQSEPSWYYLNQDKRR